MSEVIDGKLRKLYGSLFSLTDPINIESGFRSGALVSHSADSGIHYEESNFRLMYVGRDLNGWKPLTGNNVDELVENVLTNGRTKCFLSDAVHSPQYRDENTNELLYSINKSRFWQICKEVMNRAGEIENWAEKIVWSNVYKVTYQRGRRGAHWDLVCETFEPCLEILRYELEVFKPNHVVFVTGTDYFLPRDLGISFRPVFSLEHDPVDFDVISKGIYTDNSGHKIKMVAVNRPEITKGTNTEKADKIMEAFNSL